MIQNLCNNRLHSLYFDLIQANRGFVEEELLVAAAEILLLLLSEWELFHNLINKFY